MSLLQLKNLHKRNLLWLKLLGLCLFMHSIILIWMFCIYRGNSHLYALSIQKHLDYSAPVMFVPLGVQTTSQKTIAIAPKKVATIAKQSTKQAPKTTTLSAEKKKVVTSAPKTTQQTQAKNEPKKELVEKKETKTPENEKPKAISEKKENQVAKALDIEQNIIPLQKEKVESKPVEKAAIHIPENARTSHNFREVEAFRKSAQLQKELVQKWQPPIGVSTDCCCEVSFFVSKTGAIQNIKMVKSSGITMFDISARQALFTMKMPHWTYGNSLIINFKNKEAHE